MKPILRLWNLVNDTISVNVMVHFPYSQCQGQHCYGVYSQVVSLRLIGAELSGPRKKAWLIVLEREIRGLEMSEITYRGSLLPQNGVLGPFL